MAMAVVETEMREIVVAVNLRLRVEEAQWLYQLLMRSEDTPQNKSIREALAEAL